MARMRRRWLYLWLELALGLAVTACARTPDSKTATPTTRTGADKYVKRAIRQSNEGVILLPSEKAERIYELPRLNEIAQGLREPAALCFLERAIMTMERTGDERGYRDVPEGQIKIRARIAPNGQVLRTEVLETGFTDAKMSPCLEKAITKTKFPQNEGGVNHYVDVVYWVSLGLQGDVHTAEWKEHVKREQIGAGVRAKPCLEGRAAAGSYKVAALNLVDREGGTLINRIDGQGLPQELRSCVARAFRDIRLPRKADAFVRPVWAEVELVVRDDGGIDVAGEEWLRRVELEEQVKRRMKRQELVGGDAGDGSRWTEDAAPIDDGESHSSGLVDGPVGDAATEDRPLADDRIPTTEPATPQGGSGAPRTKAPDPGRGGIKIDLGTRPRAH